jgi:hypothetical protein
VPARASLGAPEFSGRAAATFWPSGREVIDVHDGLSAVSLLDVSPRGAFTYALVSITSMTRGRSTGGYCGAGQEVEWRWLQLGRQLERSEAERVESCADTIELHREDGIGTIVGRRTNFSDHAHVDCIRYDRRKPELGFGKSRSCPNP